MKKAWGHVSDVIQTPMFHTVMCVVWGLALIPTLIWWRESVLWVAFMSLYANFVGHWSAREAAKAKEEARDQTNPGSEG